MSRTAEPFAPVRGRRVVLRAYRHDELAEATEALERPDPMGSPWGPPSRRRIRTRVLRSGRLWRGRVVLAIEAGGRLVGEIQTYRHAGMEPGTVGLGISLFDPADRGRGLGTDAVRAFTRAVLERGIGVRIEAGTLPRNRPMRRVFDKTGWTHLGTREHQGVRFAMYELRSG